MSKLLRLLILVLAALAFVPASGQDLDTTLWVTNGTVHATAKIKNTLYLGGEFTYMGPNTGAGATITRLSGRLVSDSFPKVEGSVNAVVADGKGGFFIGGDIWKIGGFVTNGVAHILPDGSLDKAWRTGVQIGHRHAVVHALALHGNVLYAGGFFDALDGQTRSNLAAFDTGTGRLLSWNPNADKDVTSLAVAGGVVFAGGSFTSLGGVPKVKLGAIDALTGQVKDWNLDVTSDLDSIHGIYFSSVSALTARGNTLYVGGKFDYIGTANRTHVAAVDAATGQATGWRPEVTGFHVHTIATADTTVYLGGNFTAVNGAPRFSLAAVGATAGIPTGWTPGIPIVTNYPPSDPIYGITVYANSVYVTGTFSKIGAQERKGLAELDKASGALTPWNPDRHGTIGAIAFSDNGTMYVGGLLHSIGGQKATRLAAINTATGRALPWSVGTNGTVKALAVRENMLYVGGDFTTVNDQARKYAAAVDVASGRLLPWNPAPNAPVTALAASSTTVFIGGSFMQVGQQIRVGLAAADALTGQVVTPWNLALSGTIHSMVLRENTLYVGGRFYNINGKSDQVALLSVDATDGKPTPWRAISGANPYIVYCLRIADGKLFAGGDFHASREDYGYYTNLAMFDLQTGKTLTWGDGWLGPDPDASIRTLAILGNTLYIAGNFNRVSGTDISGTASLDIATGKATPWIATNWAQYNDIRHMAAYDGALYIGGPFSNIRLPNSSRWLRIPSLAAFGKAVNYTNTISGRIYEDANRNCVQDADEKPLPGIVVTAGPGPYFGSSDREGNYSIPVDTGRYTVRQVLPDEPFQAITQHCPANDGGYEVAFNSFGNTSSGKDFGNLVARQPYLTVAVASTRRRCAANVTVIRYANEGHAGADGVKVHLELPPYVVLLGSRHAYTRDGDKHYIFDVGPLQPGEQGAIEVRDSVVCNDPSIRGLSQCTKAWITPVNSRPPSAGWDKSDIFLGARCLNNGVVKLSIYNRGTGAMADSAEYRIFVDAQLALKRNFKIAAGDSLVFRVPANGRTVRLEADQHPDHPSKKSTNTTIEACGTNAAGRVSLGFLAQLPPDDAEAEVAIECLPIRDSYDPNDKLVLPTGVTPQHYTPTGIALSYTVRFQNTGNDYAYRVVITDTLSEFFDISTLKTGAASHPYQVSVSDKDRPVLTWTFDNINLPDSTSDAVKSNGFVQFSIKPRPGLSPKTRVENAADIFFDYNPPIRTNTTFNTIYDMPKEVGAGNAIEISRCEVNTEALAGPNRSLCEQDTVKLGAVSPLSGKGRWQRLQGSGRVEEPENPLSVVTHLAYGENVFEWSIPSNTCADDSLRARVTVTRLQLPAKPAIQLLEGSVLHANVDADGYTWFRDGIALPDRTQRITAARAGIYTVQAEWKGCPSPLSEPFPYTVTGVESPLNDFAIVQPNPNRGHFSIRLPPASSQRVTISVADVMGRVIISRFFNHYTEREWDLSQQKQGLYLVIIRTQNHLFVQKCIIQK